MNVLKRYALCSHFVVILAFFLLVLNSSVSTAQELGGIEQGIKPFGSYHGGDIDSISMSNGKLTLHLPLISYPQRGGKLHMGFSVVYNNPLYVLRDNCDNRPMCVPTAYNWYLDQVNPSGTPGALNAIQVVPDFPSVANISDVYPTRCCLVIDPDNSAHQIVGNLTADTTGYTYNFTSHVMTDRHGTNYSITYLNGSPTGLSKVEDVNGNIITPNIVNQVLTSYTDTLGRTIPYPLLSTQKTTDYSGCTGTQTTTSAYIWTPPGPSSGTSQFKFCYAAFPLSFTPPCGTHRPCNGLSGSNYQIQSIVLPNETAWTFNFDNTGSLSQITMPTGGTISYTWSLDTSCGAPTGGGIWVEDSSAAATRAVNANDGTGVHTWKYAQTYSTTQVQTVVTDPNLNDTVHVDSALGGTGCSFYETETDQYSGAYTAGNVLRKTATTYSYSTDSAIPQLQINVVPLTVTNTDVLSGKVSETVKTWDPGNAGGVLYGDLLTQKEYDYGNGAPGSLLKTTTNTYMILSGPNSSSYLANNLLSLPYTVKVQDGAGTQKALAQYNYDETSRASSGLTSAYQFDSAPPSGTYRGNNTSVLQWLNTGTFSCPNGNSGGSGGNLISKKTYFDDGMLNTSADPCGNTTTYAYNLTYWGALATIVTNALSQQTTNTYDFNTSLPASTTDPNSLMTSYSYDSSWRISQVNHPDGGQDVITHQESSFPFWTTLTSSINASQNKIEINVFDGLGRVSQHQLTSDPQGTVFTDTTYDALGRVSTVSNPYRTGTDATTSTGTTTYGYDVLSRKISVTYADNSLLKTAYCGPSTLVTDPTGRWRRSRVDGIGRLVEVDEPNAVGASVNSNGCPGTGEPIWVTSYALDGLGNLTQVVQNSSHTRTFTYDSLSRLLTAFNPENSEVVNNVTYQVTYAYNPDSTVASKTDARNTTTSYAWDALHRQTSISYSNGDPTISLAYDQSNCLGLSACQNIGHRTSMTDGAGSESWAYEVDKTNLRSIHKEQRTNNSSPNNITKTTTYYLDLAGNVTQLVYPTGRTVNYGYDSADRPSNAADSSNGITYAADWKTPPASTSCTAGAVCYTPQGSVYGMSVGQTSSFTGLNLLESFNNRLQPNEIKASSTAGTAIDITYSFVDPSTSANAGHVYKMTNNLNSSRAQSFTYDQLNRLATAGTSATSGSYCWGYQYTYDAWANLNSQAGLSGYGSCTENTSSAIADGNNHLPSSSGFSYDNAGNTQNDGNYSYTWDAESQLKTANGVTYSYDGDGRRAAKVGSKLYWYGSGGEVLAETDASGNTQNEYVFFGKERVAVLPATGGTLYYVEDFLASSRVLVQSNGTLCYDADFTPFGAERAYTTTCSQNYKFEGKERDTETANDDFGAREYTWRFGRWLSSDWSATPIPVPYANLTNPQTLNLYSMVTDDPESFSDLDGHQAVWPQPNVGSQDPNGCLDAGITCSDAEPGVFSPVQNNPPAQNPETPQTLRDQIPSVTRAAMVDAIGDSDHARGNDPTGGFHEESGVAGQVAGGGWIVSRDKPGPYANPDVEEHAHNTPAAAHQEIANLIVNPKVFFHVHPSGKTATHSWKQPPQSKDRAEAVSGKINIVFGAGDNKVYFYNSAGVIGKPMKLQDFLGH